MWKKELKQAIFHIKNYQKTFNINLKTYIDLLELIKIDYKIDESDNKPCLQCAIKHLLNFSIYNEKLNIIDQNIINRIMKELYEISKKEQK